MFIPLIGLGYYYFFSHDLGAVVFMLFNSVKGESGDGAHLLPCLPVASSGIDVWASLARLIEFKHAQGFVDGPAISDTAGHILSHWAMNYSLLKVLEELFNSH